MLDHKGVYDFFPGNGLYVDLDGTTGEAGTLQTKREFNLAPGEYRLSFSPTARARRACQRVRAR